jgi:hypothetical protein
LVEIDGSATAATAVGISWAAKTVSTGRLVSTASARADRRTGMIAMPRKQPSARQTADYPFRTEGATWLPRRHYGDGGPSTGVAVADSVVSPDSEGDGKCRPKLTYSAGLWAIVLFETTRRKLPVEINDLND